MTIEELCVLLGFFFVLFFLLFMLVCFLLVEVRNVLTCIYTGKFLSASDFKKELEKQSLQKELAKYKEGVSFPSNAFNDDGTRKDK